MNVTTVKLTRTYNLGEYESLKVGYEATLSDVEGSDNQKILDATKELEKLADTYYQMVRFSPDKKTEKPKGKIEGNIVRSAPAGPKPPTPEPLSLEAIDWIKVDDTNKEPYEKSTTKPIDFYNVKKAVEEKGKPIYVSGYIVWYMDKLDVLARRKKQ